MLLLISLVGMGAGPVGVPPTPIEEDFGDGGYIPFSNEDQLEKLRKERIKKRNKEVFLIVNSFLVCQN